MSGWIKLYRDVFKNPYMCRPNFFIVWCYILCHVVHQPEDVVFEGKRITLQPGQGLFKFTQVAKELHVTAPGLYRVIDVLKSEKQIEKQSSPRNTIITVVNWDKYQNNDKQNEEQMRNKRETNEKQMRNLPYSIKNDKNEKNEEKGRHKHGTYQNVLLSDEDLQKLQAEFPGDWQRRIERLSEYMASTGKSYKDHLATIRAWARKDAERNASMGRATTGTESEIARIQDAIRRAQEEQRTATMGTVQAGGGIPNQGVRTGDRRNGKPPV